MWFYFPDTNGLPLEEIAALFGDEEDVAVFQRDIDVHGGQVTDLHEKGPGEAKVRHVESVAEEEGKGTRV